MSELNTLSGINKLRWRCRRGTLELDILLIRYLENSYLTADAEEQQAFLRLLELEDADLMRYLMGESPSNSPDLAGLVEKIRALPA
ncbi:succinate dehydrogenase assembly factor 2 [Methylomonas sp. SURF-2]|uniref:FAD assembly factor SdhE n=1 Tax=Methylomonas subterranea TaxID=2952225 RepID=A0ABT1TE45_9GAMM|nr:succinate dehydrogenase assembly factor 2 [Methylomonas sp. SURF-2]MCQ8103732.1 succinate dehydrogenase assembly factor 2 [Methylomonas sp. SURF-2]